MSEDKKKILEMVAQNKISVDEAERLLAALDGPAGPDVETETPRRSRARYLRVQVEPSPGNPDGDRVQIRVPMNLIRAGLKWMSFIPGEARGQVQSALEEKGIDLDFQRMKPEDLEELISNLDDLQVQVEGKENVRIFCE